MKRSVVRQRERIRTDLTLRSAPCTTWTKWYPPGTSYRLAPSTRTVQLVSGTRFEILRDVVGNRGNVNPTYHLKAEIGLKPLFDYIQTVSGTYELCHDDALSNGYLIPSESLFRLLAPLPTSGQCDEFFDKAYATFNEQIPLEVSLLNFIWELREIQDLIPKIERSITRTASGGFLWWKFGIKPMLSDLKKLWLLSETVKARLEFLRKTRGQRVRLGCYAKFEPSLTTYDVMNWASQRLYLKQSSFSSVMRAGGFLTHQLEGLDDALSEVKAFAAALGLNNPAAVVWEAIPYSFVLDWFGRFQELIGKLAIQPFAGKWEVDDVSYSHSVKATYDFLHNVPVPQPSWLPQEAVRNYGQISIERYERFIGIPVPSSLITSMGLNSTQQLLALALIRQRLP